MYEKYYNLTDQERYAMFHHPEFQCEHPGCDRLTDEQTPGQPIDCGRHECKCVFRSKD
jgi:hypothetical protein